MNQPKPKPPRRKDDLIILHFDYDCFYAQVIEHRQPSLRSLPLGIKQKSILATCNYVARRRGVKKLMSISEAKKICPDLILADGEDLTPFRDASKRLYATLRSYSWNLKLERLGLDEVFLDLTDIVSYNVELLNRHNLRESWFCLSREDPELGFVYDATAVAGCVHGSPPPEASDPEYGLYLRIIVASHLARHLRLKLEEDEGYTSACGIATNKLLAKLVGNKNKPRNQTSLLAFREEDILSFMDPHPLKSIPGIGSKTTSLLEHHVGVDTATACLVRTHPGASPQLLEKLLGGRPGSEKGIGDKIWGLLHGADNREVKPAADIPTQISIEDTYPGPVGLTSRGEINHQLRLLSASLLRRMYADLVVAMEAGEERWTARPKTIRLSTRPKAGVGKPWGTRSSRSQALPGFVFGFTSSREAVVERLVREVLAPMFGKLHPEGQKGGWNIGLLNVCVAGMVLVAGEGNEGTGRDIGNMFRRQEDVLGQWRVRDDDEGDGDGLSHPGDEGRGTTTPAGIGNDDYIPISNNTAAPDDDDIEDVGAGTFSAWRKSSSDAESSLSWQDDSDAGEDGGGDGSSSGNGVDESCPRCGHLIPVFARTAHERFHDLGE